MKDAANQTWKIEVPKALLCGKDVIEGEKSSTSEWASSEATFDLWVGSSSCSSVSWKDHIMNEAILEIFRGRVPKFDYKNDCCCCCVLATRADHHSIVPHPDLCRDLAISRVFELVTGHEKVPLFPQESPRPDPIG